METDLFSLIFVLQIQCEAQAKHNIVGARTEKRRSQPQFAGLLVETSGPPGALSVEEGGPPATITVSTTVPVLCPPQDRARSDCCLSLELALTEIDSEERCPAGNILDRVGHHSPLYPPAAFLVNILPQNITQNASSRLIS